MYIMTYLNKTNNIYNKTTKERFFTSSDKVILKLSKLKCLTSWTLYFYLASKQTFKNGLIGIFEELTIYDVSIHLSNVLGKKLDISSCKHFMQKLEKNELIRTIDRSPLIVLLIGSEFSEDLDTLEETLNYVRNHEQEFMFHVHHRRAEEFFAHHKIERLAHPMPSTDGKAKALDTLIKSRPTRATAPTPQELLQATEWARTIAQDLDPFADDDPFAQHLSKNIQHIKKEKQHEQQD
jgi:hypothetical protein